MRVIRLGDPNVRWANERRVSFDVSEFAVLDNGERVIVQDERGFGGTGFTDDPRDHVTAQASSAVLTTVRPDHDATHDEHPREWLIRLLQSDGVEATPT